MFLTDESRDMSVGLLLAVATSLSAVAADLNVPTIAYPTIQAAVDAAQSSDTIHIAPGIYPGQVNIVSKTLTLIGQPGTILRATTNMTGHTGSSNIPIMEIGSSQVTVRGLTFEGERLAERFVGDGDLLGIYFRNSSGNVENCAFYGFRESTPGPEGAIAIFAYSLDDVPEATVRVVGSTFADNYAGIVLRGSSTRQNVNGTVENNIIIGPGPLPLTGVDTCGGVEIEEGVGGRIAGNTISGFSYVGTAADFPISFGILAVNEANFPPEFGPLQPLIIEGNTLRDNQEHIALVKGDNSVISNNRFQGTAPGIRPVGLGVSGTNVTIANNQFEDMPEGIQLWGNDPDYGTLLGAVVNAQVTSNRFCNVTTNINLQPLASDTETGTLLCPTPTLAIANAVILSWPNYADGWTLESAPDPLGPWTRLDATPSFQDGQYVFAVKTSAQQAFFRLRQP
jgi:hypothetical protein